MGALAVLDAHLDTLRQPWVAVPQLTAAHRQCRGEPSARNALHDSKSSTPVLIVRPNSCRHPCFIIPDICSMHRRDLDMISCRDDVLTPRKRNVRRYTLSWSPWRSEHSCLTPHVSPRPASEHRS